MHFLFWWIITVPSGTFPSLFCFFLLDWISNSERSDLLVGYFALLEVLLWGQGWFLFPSVVSASGFIFTVYSSWRPKRTSFAISSISLNKLFPRSTDTEVWRIKNSPIALNLSMSKSSLFCQMNSVNFGMKIMNEEIRSGTDLPLALTYF